MTKIWNIHNIRPSGNNSIPFGRPDVMFFTPEIWNARDQMQLVQEAELDVCSQEATFRSVVPCDEDVDQLCISVMRRDDIDPPKEFSEAIQLYRHLRNVILHMI